MQALLTAQGQLDAEKPVIGDTTYVFCRVWYKSVCTHDSWQQLRAQLLLHANFGELAAAEVGGV